MRVRNSECGASLLEYLVAVSITAIMIIAALALFTQYARRTAGASEVNTLEEDRSAVTQIWRSDLDGGGRNLTRPQGSGAGTEQAEFLPAADYISSSGVLTKTGRSGWGEHAFMSRGLGAGLGSFTFLPTVNSGGWIYGPDQHSFGMLVGVDGWMALYDDWIEVALTCCRKPDEIIPVHSPGDLYRFSVELKTEREPGTVMRLYRIRGGTTSLLWTSKESVPAYPLSFGATIYGRSQTISEIAITGAPLISLSGGATEFSLLPYDAGVRPTKPIEVSKDGQSLRIISGAAGADSAYTTDFFKSTPNEGGTLSLRLPARGNFQIGDIIDVIDFPAGRACLYKIETSLINGDGTGTFEVRPVTEREPAWGRLWSSETDAEYTFQPGATVVKFAPPVTYIVTNDNRLVRTEGSRVSTVAFNVRSFTASEQSLPTGWTFSLSMTMAAEGFETSSSSQSTETRTTAEYTSTPRALNLAANQLN